MDSVQINHAMNLEANRRRIRVYNDIGEQVEVIGSGAMTRQLAEDTLADKRATVCNQMYV